MTNWYADTPIEEVLRTLKPSKGLVEVGQIVFNKTDNTKAYVAACDEIYGGYLVQVLPDIAETVDGIVYEDADEFARGEWRVSDYSVPDACATDFGRLLRMIIDTHIATRGGSICAIMVARTQPVLDRMIQNGDADSKATEGTVI